jgi:PPP family 3-phenylpropionic acid transporter
LRRPEVLVLLVTGFLVQASHGPYYGFFTLYLQRHGYSGTVAGALWALGVVAEIGVFMVIPRLLPWIGPRRLMLTALALTVVRWLMIAQFVDKMGFLIFAQTLHMASFGVYHAVAIHYVYRFFPGRLQGRGQALYSSLTFGAGVAAGTSAAGYLWDHVAPASAYLGAAGAAALALVIAASALPESPPEAASKE